MKLPSQPRKFPQSIVLPDQQSILNDTQKLRLLRDVKTVAIVGLSPKPSRPSHRVAQAMQKFAYKIVPVRPDVASVLGEKAYNSIADIPFKVDLVNVFRAPEHVPLIVDQCIQCEIPAIWLQEGIIHDQAAQTAKDAGLSIVMDKCLYKEIIRLGLNDTYVDQ